jgi:hypothetical protein
MKLNRRGLIATILYHTLLLLLLLLAGLTFPVPPPEEEGILVNFGTDDSGFGEFEPMGDNQNEGDPDLPVAQEAEEVPEEVFQPVEETEPEPVQEQYTPPPDPVPADQTQDVEETPVQEEPQPTAEELEQQRLEQERLERERREREEAERQRLEQERIERERREREEAERLERERIERERQQQAERIQNMGRDAFGRQGAGETEGSEGVTEGTGNQGDINGTPDADQYGTGGGLGEGISYGLGSRKALGNLPKPNVSGCEVTQRIVVTVEIQVDRQGKVLSAIVQSATYQDNCIWNMVVDAAKRSRFSMDENAAYKQNGWIRYIIEP